MTIGDMLNQYFRTNNQAKFARAIGVKESTVTRWKNNDIPPNFENCLRIARLFGKHPKEIFEAAGREEYYELFIFFFPGYQPVAQPTPMVGEDQKKIDSFSPEMRAFVRGKLDECGELDKAWNPRRKKREMKQGNDEYAKQSSRFIGV